MDSKTWNWGNQVILALILIYYRAERFYYLGFSLGKIIDLGNVVNTVSLLFNKYY